MPRLKDSEVRSAKPGAAPFKLYDGLGLFVLVHPNGSKYARMRYVLYGREKVLALGTYPDTSLARARELVREARVKLQQGIDPAMERRKAKLALRAAAGQTFVAVAEEWYRVKAAYASANYQRDIRAVLNGHLLPRLGPLPVSAIDAPVLLGVLRAVEARGKLELARRCRMWLRQILDFATATGVRSGDNPARALTADVLLRPPRRENRPALRADEAGVFLRRLVDYPGKPETRLAVTLLLLTAARPGEVQRARWEEFDAREKVWRIPAAKMKARRDHIVPMSTQAIAVLEELRNLTGHSEWLFPGPSKRMPHLSENTLGKAFKLLYPERHIVPHGCRAFFSTYINESRKFPTEVIELALAHAPRDTVAAAYNRAQHLKQRRRLLVWWGNELDALRAGA